MGSRDFFTHIVRDYRIYHDDVIKWKHFPRYWPFVRGIHRSPVNSPHKGQWRGASMLSLICARIDDLVNNGEAGDFRRHRSHYDVIVIIVAQCRHMAADFLVNNYSDTGLLPDRTKLLLETALSYDQAEWSTRFFFFSVYHGMQLSASSIHLYLYKSIRSCSQY